MATTATKENTTMTKTFKGVVTSNKMKDTVVVEITRYVKHPKYHKFLKLKNKVKAHDAGNTKNIGDTVVIAEVKPISKDKSFKVM